MKKNRKKFKDTAVGKTLLGVASIINPTLGSVLSGATSIPEAIEQVTAADVPVEDKIRLKQLLIDAYEAEVADRVSARNREAVVAAAGGSDILFKTVGWGITLSFILIVLYAIGVIPQLDTIDKDYLMFASGAVTAAFTQVIGYYFGSSMGSKQKTLLQNGTSE